MEEVFLLIVGGDEAESAIGNDLLDGSGGHNDLHVFSNDKLQTSGQFEKGSTTRRTPQTMAKPDHSTSVRQKPPLIGAAERAGAAGHGGKAETGKEHDVETVTVVLSVGDDRVDEFEAGFRKHEVPVWEDLKARGLLARASLNRLDISSNPVKGATQYLVVAVFTSGEGHHAHDDHPGFKAWNEIADTYQVGGALAFGGETIIQLDD
jgi:hypothetical protein